MRHVAKDRTSDVASRTAEPSRPMVGKHTLVESYDASHSGVPGRGPIQAKLTPEGERAAQAWQAQVLEPATLPHSRERDQIAALLGVLRNEPSDPAEGDRRLLELFGSFTLPQADPDAIFADAVPGQIAVQQITQAHQGIVTMFQRHVEDEYVERKIGRAVTEHRERTDQGQAIAAVRSGTFTSSKDNRGDLSPSVNTEHRAQILEQARHFTAFVAAPEQRTAVAASGVLLYRRVKSPQLQQLTVGATLDEILPFSASWKQSFAEDWSPGEGVIFEIDVPLGYPMLFQARRPGAPQSAVEPLNQAQGEVTLQQSRLTVTQAPRRVEDARRNVNVMIRVTATPLALDVAIRQHNAMAGMSDEHRRAVAAQQRDEDPVGLDTTQQAIATSLVQLRARIDAVIALASRAVPHQVTGVGQYIASFAAKSPPPCGPALSVMQSFGILGGGDQPLLATLLRRLFNAEYYAGCAMRPDQVSGLLALMLQQFEQRLAPIQQHKLVGDARLGGAADAAVAAPSATGEPLADDLRATMEGAFHSDFSDVRVHHGSHVSAIGALAYTRGTQLHFAPGQYAPDTAAGRELVGHELAHVVQQRSGRVAAPDGAIDHDAQLEAEADAAGARAARGDSGGLTGSAGGARAAGGPVQRKIVATGDADRRAQQLIEQHSSRQDILAQIRSSPAFTLFLMAGETPPSHLSGTSGVTIASLYEKKHLLARISESTAAASLDVATLKRIDRMEVEVWGFITEKHATDDVVIPANQAGQAMALIHEVERHAFPFFDLFTRIQTGQFFADAMKDDSELAGTASDLSSGKAGNAIAQHLDPELAARTARTVLSLADQVGGAQAAELVFRLYLDTIERGVAFAALRDHYVKSGGQPTAAWKAFEALVARLTGAVPGERVTGPLSGRRVVVADGVFRGRDGVVDPLRAPQDVQATPDEIHVQLASGGLVAMPKRSCYFLRQ
jgi:Domain of unknown function (DUF4157)